MTKPLHPTDILYLGVKPLPALAACEHYAGNEKLIRKALQLQSELGPIFDITADCEDGAPSGHEKEHAEMVAALISEAASHVAESRNEQHICRIGARIHDITHPHWCDDLDIIIGAAGNEVAYIVIPKPESFDDAATQIAALDDARKQHGIKREIPVHVLIETHGALNHAWQIAALPQVESLDFGLMDFVSAHHGAIPASAMKSPGQFNHPLIARAKCEIAAAALGNGIIATHNVTTEIHDVTVVRNDAMRAQSEFGFLRMWSIHPNQILPIIEAMRPSFDDIHHAGDILAAAQEASWGPIKHEGKLHDRASYRFYWELLQRAHATGMKLTADTQSRFFS
ncbi:MAG: aldolase/citrate lyase family protein [Georgfuchsia sp.]